MSVSNAKQELRLSERDIEYIKKIKDFVDADIYIFGSRLDLNKRGGDIDILLVPKTDLSAEEKVILKMKIRSFLEEALLKPVDIVFENNTIRREIGYKID